MQRILQDSATRIAFQVTDDEDLPVDADDGVRVTVFDGAGLELVAEANATHGEQGDYTTVLGADEAAFCDVLEILWTYEVDGLPQKRRTHVEVVGGFYFTIAEARTFDNGALSEDSLSPAAEVARARAGAEQRIEDLCGFAFVPRGRRLARVAAGAVTLTVPDLAWRRLIAGRSSTTVFGMNAIADLEATRNGQVLTYPLGWFSPVALHYEHGLDEPPEAIRDAAKILTKHALVSSDVDDRTISISNEIGTQQLVIPGGRFGSTGIPTVDAAIADYAVKRRAGSVPISSSLV